MILQSISDGQRNLEMTHRNLLLLSAERLLKVLVFLQQSFHAVQGVSQVFVQKESLQRCSVHQLIQLIQSISADCVSAYLLLAHPVVHLLRVPVEQLQVHALFVLLPADLPQLQEGLLLLGQDPQLHTHRTQLKHNQQINWTFRRPDLTLPPSP